MTTITYKREGTPRSSERGNVLFLILIAVALFAALSYAVTQSTRSGGGDAGRETTLVNSSTITQYPASIKTAIVRMIVSNGVSADQLIFDAPSAFGSLSPTQHAQNVFHPIGGGSSYALAPASVMANAGPGTWRFNAANQIYNIGQDGNPGNDIIAFLPGVSQSICERIHDQLGIIKTFSATAALQETAALYTTTEEKDFDNPAIPATAGPVIGDSGGSPLNGQPQGCFLNTTPNPDEYVYYHVLVER